MSDWWDTAMEYAAKRSGERMDELDEGEAETHELVWQRKICWPKPDATCLEGGCIHCDTGSWKPLRTVQHYVERAGILQNRGKGSQPARKAWVTGVTNGFFERPRIRRIKQKRRKQSVS